MIVTNRRTDHQTIGLTLTPSALPPKRLVANNEFRNVKGKRWCTLQKNIFLKWFAKAIYPPFLSRITALFSLTFY